jgi:hypothetical protein
MERLGGLRADGGIEIVDAVLVTWDARAIHLSARDRLPAGPGGSRLEQEGRSRAFDALFPPAILSLKPVGASADGALSHFLGLGFGVNLLKELGENLPARGSAIVLIMEEHWLRDLVGALGTGSSVSRFAMDPDASSWLPQAEQPSRWESPRAASK